MFHWSSPFSCLRETKEKCTNYLLGFSYVTHNDRDDKMREIYEIFNDRG